MRIWNSPTCRCAGLSCGGPGHRSCLLGRPDSEPALMRVRLQTIPQRLPDGLGKASPPSGWARAIASARYSDWLKFKNPPAPAVKRRQKRSEADERRGAYVVAKIRQIEYELGIITGLSRGFEQRRARADGADAPVRLDFELRNEGKLPENWGSAPAARGRFSGTRRINHLSFQWAPATESF